MKQLIFYIFLTFAFVFNFNLKAQKYPIPILPSNTLKIYTNKANERILVYDTNSYKISYRDTLWLITHRQIKKTIETAKKNEILEKQNAVLYQIKDSLTELTKQQKILIDTLKKDRDFYVNLYKASEVDLQQCQLLAKRQNRYFKMALIGGALTSVGMFFLGAYLFH